MGGNLGWPSKRETEILEKTDGLYSVNPTITRARDGITLFPFYELLVMLFIHEFNKYLSFYYVPDIKYWKSWTSLQGCPRYSLILDMIEKYLSG